MRLVLIDFRHPFFRPMTRRVVIFSLVAIWTVVEFFVGSTGWVIFFAALSAYVGWGFFLSGQPDEAPADEPEPDNPARGDVSPDGGKSDRTGAGSDDETTAPPPPDLR